MVVTKIDPLDVIVLTILQADEQFMHGHKYEYEIVKEQSDSLLSKIKKRITDAAEDDCAVETCVGEELDGRRVLQMRINNKLTIVVAVLRSAELNVPLPESYPKPKCRICYLHPFTQKMATVLSTYAQSKLNLLIEKCYSFVGLYLSDFEKYVVNDTQMYVLNSHNPERSFSIRY